MFWSRALQDSKCRAKVEITEGLLGNQVKSKTGHRNRKTQTREPACQYPRQMTTVDINVSGLHLEPVVRR